MNISNVAIISLFIVTAKQVKNAVNNYHAYDTYTTVTDTVKNMTTFESVKSYYESMPEIDPVMVFHKSKSKNFKRIKIDTFVEPKKVKSIKSTDKQYF